MQEFFDNISRYPRYFITISLGILYSLFVKPFLPLLNRPVTAIALISLAISSFIFLSFTLRAMLGLNAG
ncbi:MAG: DUF751 family protein [Cyanothece sp. SIO2G6]|nr:DUF751 family protein [Cyanothece sp. SIO2G6]